jgi:hypothetical protein
MMGSWPGEIVAILAARRAAAAASGDRGRMGEDEGKLLLLDYLFSITFFDYFFSISVAAS